MWRFGVVAGGVEGVAGVVGGEENHGGWMLSWRCWKYWGGIEGLQSDGVRLWMVLDREMRELDR